MDSTALVLLLTTTIHFQYFGITYGPVVEPSTSVLENSSSWVTVWWKVTTVEVKVLMVPNEILNAVGLY